MAAVLIGPTTKTTTTTRHYHANFSGVLALGICTLLDKGFLLKSGSKE
jgi:hypothetical protein